MKSKRKESAKAAIQALVDLVEEKYPAETAPTIAEFMRNYYRGMPADDLVTTPAADLYGAAR